MQNTFTNPFLYFQLNRFKNLYRWARFRHGFGVHSPFAFSLINDVIEEKYGYYGYATIANRIKSQSLSNSLGDSFSLKYNHLLFRMSLRFQPKHVLLLGCEGSESMLYLQADNLKRRVTLIETNPRKIHSAFRLIGDDKQFDILSETDAGLLLAFENIVKSNNAPQFTYFHRSIDCCTKQKALDMCLKFRVEQSILIIDAIHSSKEMMQLWKYAITQPEISTSFDLLEAGILVIDKRLNKQNYRLSF